MLKRKKTLCIYLIVFFFTLNSTFSQSNFQKFEYCRNVFLNSDTASIKTLEYCNDAKQYKNMYPQLAGKYFSISDEKKAFEYLKKAYLEGLDASYFMLTYKIDKKYEEEILKYYYEYNKLYSSRIDENLNNKLCEMKSRDQEYRFLLSTPNISKDSVWKLQNYADSLNLADLKNIVLQHGWPSFDKVGFLPNCSPDLIVIHGSEDENYYYLDKILSEKVIDWFSASTIMSNILWRFQFLPSKIDGKKIGFNKLRYTYTHVNKIDKEKSYFQLKNLVKTANNNKVNLEIFICKIGENDLKYNSEERRELLKSLKEELIKLGFTNEIKIVEEVKIAEPDELPEYIFGFRSSKIRDL